MFTSSSEPRFHVRCRGFGTVINIHERAGLLTISPDLNGIARLCTRNLTVNRRWGLLPTAIIRPERTAHGK